MLIRNITSLRDLQNQKKLQAELLQMQIDNQNVLTKRIADYQNPNKPPPVPPQYKTSTEIMQDSMAQQKQVIDNLRTIGADFQTATQVSQELMQLPDGVANLVKVNKFFPTIQKDFEKRISKKNIDAQTLMAEFLKFFSNLDSAIGVNIKDTDATTMFSREPLIGKELLASKEDYADLSNLLEEIFYKGTYNKREVEDPIKEAVDNLYAKSPTTAQLVSIDHMPILERQQYNKDVEQLSKVYKLPESKSINDIKTKLNEAFRVYEPVSPDTKLQLDYQIARLENILNRVNEKSLRALKSFTKSFEPSEEIGRIASEKIAQPTEAQLDKKAKIRYIKAYVDKLVKTILNRLNLVKPTEEELQQIKAAAEEAGMGVENWKDSENLETVIRNNIGTPFLPFYDEQIRLENEQRQAIEEQKIARLRKSGATRKITKAFTQGVLRKKEEAERLKQEKVLLRQQMAGVEESLPILDEIIGSVKKDDTKPPGYIVNRFLKKKYNQYLPEGYRIDLNSNRGRIVRTRNFIEEVFTQPETQLEGVVGFGLTDRVLKHFNEDNRDLLKLKKGFNKHLKVEKEADSESGDDSSYSGKGVRKNYAFNGRRIKLGKGVSINKDMPKYREFGKYIVHYPQLIEENVLNLKFPSTGTIPSIKPVHIDDNFKEFIIDVLDWGKVNQRHYDSLTEPEKSHFLKIARGAKVLNTLKFKTPVEDKEEEDIKRLQLLFGELNAGNDNPNMIKECKVLIKKYISNGRINKNKGLEMLMELE